MPLAAGRTERTNPPDVVIREEERREDFPKFVQKIIFSVQNLHKKYRSVKSFSRFFLRRQVTGFRR
jgi:hypothetical protein